MMDAKRKGEIALLVLKMKLREQGMKIKPATMKRHIGSTAKVLGITTEEASEFMEMMVRELVEETFTKK